MEQLQRIASEHNSLVLSAERDSCFYGCKSFGLHDLSGTEALLLSSRKQVCVIHEEYLHQMTEDDMDALPGWSASGYVFEAAKFSDRTVREQVERVILKVTADEIGLVLEGK